MTVTQIARPAAGKPRASHQDARDDLVADLPKLQALCVETFGDDAPADALRQALTLAAHYMLGHDGALVTKALRREAQTACSASQKVRGFLDRLPPQQLAAMLSGPVDPEHAQVGKGGLLLHGLQRAEALIDLLSRFETGVPAFQTFQPSSGRGRPERPDPIDFLIEVCLGFWKSHAVREPNTSRNKGCFMAFTEKCADHMAAAARGSLGATDVRRAVQHHLSKPRRKRVKAQTDRGSSAGS